MKKYLALVALAFSLLCSPALALTCNDPSGWIKVKGTIATGDVLVMGPDCQSAQDGGVPSGGGGAFIAGRITLVSGLAVMQTSQAGATRVYFTPFAGNTIPVSLGGLPAPVIFAEVFQDTTDATKSPAAVAPNSCYDLLAWLDGGTTFRVTRGPAWTAINPGVRAMALTFVGGNFFNAVGVTNGPSAGNGTYVGTICSNASGTIDYIFGGIAAGGNPAKFGVWNITDVEVDTFIGDNTASWTYGVAAWRVPNGNTNTMVVLQARGLNYNGVQAEYHVFGQGGAGSAGLCGVGVGSTTAFSGSVMPTASVANTFCLGKYSGLPGIGYININPLENNVGGAASTWFGNATTTQSAFHFKGRM